MKKYYCIECGTEISEHSGKYGQGRCQPCSVQGERHPMFGKYHTEITKKKLRGVNKGKNSGTYIDGRCSKTYYCPKCGKKINYKTALYASGLCKSCSHKGNKESLKTKQKRIQNSIKANHKFPNKKEKLLNKLLLKLFPNEYKYVGSGDVILGGFNPDFINVNGQKKIIELYGDYWHNLPGYKERDKRRLNAYKEFGYKTLIIWEKELRNKGKLIEKLLKF